MARTHQAQASLLWVYPVGGPMGPALPGAVPGPDLPQAGPGFQHQQPGRGTPAPTPTCVSASPAPSFSPDVRPSLLPLLPLGRWGFPLEFTGLRELFFVCIF